MDNGYKPFSERHGQTTPKMPQRKDMDDDLRNGLWNAFYDSFPERFENNFYRNHPMYRKVFVDFIKGPADEYISNRITDNNHHIRIIFDTSEWHSVFDLIEFVIRHSGNEDFVKRCNTVLERENSAYRVITEGIVTEITSEQEIEAIETALQIPYASAKEHIAKALTFLSDRQNPDYENRSKHRPLYAHHLLRLCELHHLPKPEKLAEPAY